jgi:hypothetical protein
MRGRKLRARLRSMAALTSDFDLILGLCRAREQRRRREHEARHEECTRSLHLARQSTAMSARGPADT